VTPCFTNTVCVPGAAKASSRRVKLDRHESDRVTGVATCLLVRPRDALRRKAGGRRLDALEVGMADAPAAAPPSPTTRPAHAEAAVTSS